MLKSEIIRLYCLSVIFILGNSCHLTFAQSPLDEYKRQIEEKFNQFNDSKQKAFDDYRNSVNQEFSDFMRRKWNKHETKHPVPTPPVPEPPEPAVADPDETPSNETLPFVGVVTTPDISAPPVPLLPTSERDTPEIKVSPSISIDPTAVTNSHPTEKGIDFIYYGNRCHIPFNRSFNISLKGVDENSVADAWTHLSSYETVDLVRHCVEIKNTMCLPDWGYLRLSGCVADAICPHDCNASTLLQMFVLTQSGYKVRIGRTDGRLILLIPSKEMIYSYSYIEKDGLKYYIFDRPGNMGPIYLFDHGFPGEQPFSLSMSRQPRLSVSTTQSRMFNTEYPVKIEVSVAVNKNLIDFYNDYPLSNHWNIYSNASLSGDVKNQLYPKLIKIIEGKTKTEAANILLRFVQTAFEYKTDDEQFGMERSLFPDETFYYPYSDCEDRAILYSVFVKELLGLDVVLVAYPRHLATAVRFDGDVKGDYFVIDGNKYTVCDPTYINANVGMAMRQLKNSSAEIIRL